jgi:hypothetical protein
MAARVVLDDRIDQLRIINMGDPIGIGPRIGMHNDIRLK